MISEAIQQTLAAIIPNTYMSMGDEEIITPYATHRETGVPNYGKAGILGYTYQVEVLIVDDTPDKVEQLLQSVKNALRELEGTTVCGTGIELVIWEDDEPDFDIESQMYTSVSTFTIDTSNR